ncbi:Tim44/TimA family putative adaptor protein [Sphingomonas bacterium]|uniref:Tim44/TimA family putative adaptor protein n=1 Tax=Sphingomonas bacterium TaxID=1895847 RepID=UPI001575912C|nr:Tim44/TimA family putative adaptor protein [Sphingomonas bacterium]
MFPFVLLLMLAAFAALRLYSVLGKRTGHEQQSLPKAAEKSVVPPLTPRLADPAPEAREGAGRPIEQPAEAGMRAIVAADLAFDVGQFIAGAQSAYRMVLDAFWKGDAEQLAWLVEPDVKAAFAQAIAARDTAGHRLDNRLVSIERATIVDAALAGRDARITVRFDADIAAVTRDAEGQVIAGSITDAVQTHDLWTFARTLKSNDPNWKLADTDEA